MFCSTACLANSKAYTNPRSAGKDNGRRSTNARDPFAATEFAHWESLNTKGKKYSDGCIRLDGEASLSHVADSWRDADPGSSEVAPIHEILGRV